jgi:hypothetical protein
VTGSAGATGTGSAGGGTVTGSAGATGTGSGATGTGSAGATGSVAEAFVGTWRYATGATTTSCPGALASSEATVGTLVIEQGATAGSLIVTKAGFCNIPFSGSGDLANIDWTMGCQIVDNEETDQYGFSLWTLSLSNDGQTLSESRAGPVNISLPGAATQRCSYTETGVTLRRVN